VTVQPWHVAKRRSIATPVVITSCGRAIGSSSPMRSSPPAIRRHPPRSSTLRPHQSGGHESIMARPLLFKNPQPAPSCLKACGTPLHWPCGNPHDALHPRLTRCETDDAERIRLQCIVESSHSIMPEISNSLAPHSGSFPPRCRVLVVTSINRRHLCWQHKLDSSI
jgi:hypothetical protein